MNAVLFGLVAALGAGADAEWAPPSVMTLEQCLELAERQAPSLLVDRARAAGGATATAVAGTWLQSNPALSFAAGPRFDDGLGGADVDLGVSQELDLVGAAELRRRTAEARAAVLDDALRSATQALRRAVQMAYFEALLAAEAERGADQALAAAEQAVTVAQRRVEAGDLPVLDATLARAEAARAREQRLMAVGARRAARIELALRVGADVVEVEPQSTALEIVDVPPLAVLVAAAREHDPALRRYRAEAEVARRTLLLADRDAFPAPALGLSYGAEGVAAGAPSMVQVVRATLDVPLPLWRWNDAGRGQARTELAVAEAAERAHLATVEKRLALARALLEAQVARIALHAADILPAVEENARLTREAFALGDADATQVVAAQQRWSDAQTAALEAKRAWLVALRDLESALGVEVSRLR